MKAHGNLLPLPICLALASLLFSAAASAQSQQQFLVAPNYASGGSYTVAAAGDFNKDGKLDLVAMGDSGNGNMSVLLGNGDGTFQPPVNYPLGYPTAAVVADFNGDGNLDIAVTSFGPTPFGCSENQNQCQSILSIFLGNGDGTFRPRMDFAIGGLTPETIAVGDFNGDGKLDLVIGDIQENPEVVSVLLGNGDGTFQPPVTFTTGGSPQSVAVGDFNRDGKSDLAVVSWVNGGPNLLSIFIGKGDGTFQAAVNYATSSSPSSVVVTDVNGDGKPDLVVACSDGVNVLLGNGDGTFQPYINYSTGGSPGGLVVADFNGDGKPDLALTVGYQTLAIGFGNGDGTFQAPIYYVAGTNFFGPSGPIAGDFNGDGKPDLVVGGGLPMIQGDSVFGVLLNDGKGGFQAARSLVLSNAPQEVTLADLNGDGKLDLIAGTGSGASVMLGNGDGTFQREVDYSGGGSGVGDFNGDGIPDLTNGATVLLGKGDGTFGAPSSTGVVAGPVAIADFNGDGKLDLAVCTPSGLAILLGKGDGTFQTPVMYQVGGVAIAAADFNGDGKPDLVLAAGVVSVLINRGDGTFLPAVTYPTSSPISLATAVAVGDFNMDGHLDLAVANGAVECNAISQTCTAGHSLAILLGNGDGTFQSAVNYETALAPSSIVVADFNGDGKQDVAMSNASSGAGYSTTMSLLWGNGDGTFRPHLDYHVGSSPVALAVGDLNGDSKPDLAVALAANTNNGVFNAATVLLNTTSGPASVLSATVAGGEGTVSSQPPEIMCGVAESSELQSQDQCTASYASGTSVTLLPQPIPTYAFTGWSGDCTGAGACVVDMNADRSVVANFGPTTATFTLTIAFAGNGSGEAGTGAPGCTSTCSNSTIPAGALIVLEALPDSGSTFGGWSGAGCTAAMIECIFALNSDVTVTATFNAAQAPADFSITPASASLTIPAGGQQADVITVAPLNGSFTSAVQLSCAVAGSTPLATCSLSSNSVTPGANSATSKLMVMAPTQTAQLTPSRANRLSSPLYAVFLPVPLALIGLRLANRKSKNRSSSFWLLCILSMVPAAWSAGCGGGSSNPPPPALNYTVTVTATSGAIQHTTQIAVTVPQ